MQEKIIPHEKALEFILGGNALFTVRSVQTGVRFTFKVMVSSKRSDLLYVKVLNGPDNTSNYYDIGTIVMENMMPVFKASHNMKDAPCVKAFSHIIFRFAVELPMPGLEIWHNGRCCRCGRVLTVPESIENGIGPECITKVARVAI